VGFWPDWKDAWMAGQRRAKRFLSPQQKYEIWVRILRGETTVGAAADEAGVDRSTVMKLREVARQGALAALAQSRPGLRKGERDHELEAAKTEIVRLGEALKEMSVRLMLVEGKGRWD
jgi:transposase-like protein